MFRSPSRRRLSAAVAALAVLLTGAALAAPAGAAPAADPTLTEQYDAVGSSHIAKINADLPIAPTKLTSTLDLINFDIVDGTLPIAPQVITFDALGSIPIRSTVTLVQASPITGKLTVVDPGGDTTLASSVDYTIKLSNIEVSVAGHWQSLYVGPNCQTITPVTIPVSSPQGEYFDVTEGGHLTGTYTIGNFQNCAPLNLPDVFGVGSLPVNALVPGPGNTVDITLSNGQFVSST